MKSRYSRMLAVLAVSALLVAGCGNQQQQSADVAVNSYKIVSQNAQVDQTYTGTVKAENSVLYMLVLLVMWWKNLLKVGTK